MSDHIQIRPDPWSTSCSPVMRLPSGIWTSDYQVVEQETLRLLVWHNLLSDLIDSARQSDGACSWYWMLIHSVGQLNDDLNELEEWLDNCDAFNSL